jgi:hypothetical protein
MPTVNIQCLAPVFPLILRHPPPAGPRFRYNVAVSTACPALEYIVVETTADAQARTLAARTPLNSRRPTTVAAPSPLAAAFCAAPRRCWPFGFPRPDVKCCKRGCDIY